ncbi:MAG: AAA family ATPase [Trueperaceae bacterium]
MALQKVMLPEQDGGFPFDLPILRTTRVLSFVPGVTVLVGENGSGKSTLLEAIALAADLPATGSAADLGRDDTLDAVRPLADALKLVWTQRSKRGLFLRAEDYFGYVQAQRRNVRELRAEAKRVSLSAADVHEGERRRRIAPFLGSAAAIDSRYGGDLDARSHGESYLAFFRGRLTGAGLYLLDEPEAALSPLRQLALLTLIKDAVARGAQFVIATHAPILMALPGARLLEIAEGVIVERMFDDLEHVRVMREFLDAPEAFVRHL